MPDISASSIVTLEQIAPREAFEQEVAEGWLTRRDHQTAPYEIWNYTDKAQFDRHWNPVTRAARGLITHRLTGEIIARPFPKFFNLGEDGDQIPDGPVVITAKVDGSLGILYRLPDGQLAIATRGSFHSDQAVHATRVLHTRYADFQPEPGLTYLFEIIYPDNRIVVDYGEYDDLVLLGAVNIKSGRSISPVDLQGSWPGPVTPVYSGVSILDLDKSKIAENEEGFVAHFLESDTRLKIKGEWYMRIQRFLSHTSPKTIAEILMSGEDLDEFVESAPPNLRSWVVETAEEIKRRHAAKIAEATAEYESVKRNLEENFSRKDFALTAARSPNAKYLFALLDNKDIAPLVWRDLELPENTMPSLAPDPEDRSLNVDQLSDSSVSL